MAILTPRGRATFWPENALFARRCDGAVARSAPDTKNLSPKAHFVFFAEGGNSRIQSQKGANP